MDFEVRVPATVANLGPGFDCLGVAVGVHLRLRIVPSEDFEVTGVGKIRHGDENLTQRSYLAAFEETGAKAVPVRFEYLEVYPSGRGLGASASAIVAGLVAARYAGDLDFDDAELVGLASRIEGHSDNVLPALFGGLVLSAHHGWSRFEPSPAIAPLLLVARDSFKTSEARRVLPADVPRADAVLNAAAVAMLVSAVTGGESPASLMPATEDRLHEPYRLPLMPETLDLHRTLRAEGIATALAGAGPSLICLTPSDRRVEVEALARKIAPAGWEVMSPPWDLSGAEIR